MKGICFVYASAYDYFYDEDQAYGGAERQLKLLSQALRDHYDVEFIVGDYGQPPIDYRGGITLYSAHKPDSKSSVLNQVLQVYDLFRALAKTSADVVIKRDGVHKPVIIWVITLLLRKQFLYNLANDSNLTLDYDNAHPVWRWLFRLMLKYSSGVIVQTEYQASLLESRFGRDSIVVPNGYPEKASEISFNGSYFLWVSRLDKDQKRPHLFIKLAEKLPEYDFILIGPQGDDEEYASEIQNEVDRLENVQYLGTINPNSILEYYDDAIALVNTSKYEGFPNTFLEAWRSGTPVVSLTIKLSRFLDWDSCFADDDFQELVYICYRLASDKEYRQSEGRECLAYFEKNYTMMNVSNEYSVAVEELTNQNRSNTILRD